MVLNNSVSLNPCQSQVLWESCSLGYCHHVEILSHYIANLHQRPVKVKCLYFPVIWNWISSPKELLKINEIGLPASISCTNLDSTADFHLSLFQHDPFKHPISTRCYCEWFALIVISKRSTSWLYLKMHTETVAPQRWKQTLYCRCHTAPVRCLLSAATSLAWDPPRGGKCGSSSTGSIKLSVDIQHNRCFPQSESWLYDNARIVVWLRKTLRRARDSVTCSDGQSRNP